MGPGCYKTMAFKYKILHKDSKSQSHQPKSQGVAAIFTQKGLKNVDTGSIWLLK